MGHRKNLNLPGHAHELTFTCYRRYPFLAKQRTCRWLAESLRRACDELEVHLWAYVFMPEHVHVVVWPTRPSYDIAELRRRIKEPVGRQAMAYLEEHAPEWLPRVTRQRGSRTERLFWQSGGGYDRNMIETRTLGQAIDYVHANPVRRGLVVKPQDWLWSSAGWYLERRAGPCRVDAIAERFGVE